MGHRPSVLTAKHFEVDATDVEHIGALVSGGLLLATGLHKGGFLGRVFQIAGCALLFRGQKGYRRLHESFGLSLPNEPSGIGRYNVRAEAEVIVARPARDLYRIWRNLENLPVFMTHLVSVEEKDDTFSHWVAQGPLGMVIKWDAMIISDVEDEVIAWQSMEGSGVDNAGSIRFEAIDEETTVVKVVLRYDPPAEHLGTFVAKLFGRDPQTEIRRDLHQFKRIMESTMVDSTPRASLI